MKKLALPREFLYFSLKFTKLDIKIKGTKCKTEVIPLEQLSVQSEVATAIAQCLPGYWKVV
jgi:hypothetical protein